MDAVASHATQSLFPDIGGTSLQNITFKFPVALRVENKNEFVLRVVIAVVNANRFHDPLFKAVAN